MDDIENIFFIETLNREPVSVFLKFLWCKKITRQLPHVSAGLTHCSNELVTLTRLNHPKMIN